MATRTRTRDQPVAKPGGLPVPVSITKDDESHISKLLLQVRIVLTSQTLPDIYNAFNDVKHVRSMSMDAIPSESTEHDIFHYVLDELKGIKIEEDDMACLSSASGGLFEWARLSCAYVRGDDDAESSVKECVKDIFTRNQGNRVLLLNSMYTLTLETVFPCGQQKHSMCLDQFRSVMAQILESAEPLSLDALTCMRSHFMEDSLKEIEVETIVKPMGALLSGTTNSSAMICPLHASFPQFLTDKEQSSEFFIDLSHIHNDLAAASLGVMKDKLQFSICHLPSSYLANLQIPDLDQQIKDFISLELSYSCRFWMYHLERAQFDVTLATAIQRLLDHEQLLFWIEILSLLRTLNTCASSMSSVIQWVMSHADCKDISDHATDVQRFVRIFGGPISLSTLHLYLLVVPFSPRNSHIDSKFASKFIKSPHVVAGGSMDWPMIQGVFNGHSNWVYSVAFSPDGKCIVSSSSDRTIWLWDAETGEQVRPPLEGHEHLVLSVAFLPDGKCIVSGSEDMTIRLWDAETGEQVGPALEGHEDSVQSVVFSSDGKRIVSGSGDRTMQLWNGTKTGKRVDVEQNLIRFSSNPKYALTATDGIVGKADLQERSLRNLVTFFKSESSHGDGWVLIGSERRLLFWVPPIYHAGWYWPLSLEVIIPVPLQLDLSQMAHGESWTSVYPQKSA